MSAVPEVSATPTLLRSILRDLVLSPGLPSQADIDILESLMRRLPQAEAPTKHVLADGIYARELHSPKGSVIVGKVHRRAHVYVIACGTVMVLGDGYREEITGPRMIVGKPGTKRVVLMLTDATRIAVSNVGELTDLDEIERYVCEPDAASMFDARNELRPPPLEVIP